MKQADYILAQHQRGAGRPSVRRGSGLLRVKDLCFVLLAMASSCLVRGQVVLDGTVGARGPLTGPHYEILPKFGSQVGPNLFHSFSQFNLKPQEVARFSGPADVHSIFARVTGGSASSIDGTIESTVAGADFYFLNPAGVLFGPNATINVDGSFTASTADYIKLGDNGRFTGRNPAESVLTAAPVEAFGFLGPTASPINILKSKLAVKPEASFSLIAGDTSITQGSITAPAGGIKISAITGPTEISASSAAPTEGKGANVKVDDRSTLNVSGISQLKGGRSGEVRIKGGRITISETSNVHADTVGSGQGGGIELAGDTEVAVLSSVLSSETFTTGKAGAIRLRAPTVRIDGEGLFAGVLTDATHLLARATAGDIEIESKDLTIKDAFVSSVSQGRGNSGNITVASEDSVHLIGNGLDLGTALDADSEFEGVVSGGTAGKVSIKTGNLEVRAGGTVSANSFGGAAAGSITVEADKVLVDGTVKNTSIPTGFAVQNSGAEAGSISIRAGSVELIAGGTINSSTFGPGKGGNIEITGRETAKADLVRIDDHGAKQPAGIAAQAGSGSTGDGGDVHVAAKLLQISGGGGEGSSITSTTFGSGKAGNIEVEADVVDIHGYALPVSAKALLSPGRAGQITSGSAGIGSGGTIRMNAQQIALAQGGSINSLTTKAGDSGTLFVSATDSIALSEHSAISANALSANAEPVTIRAGNRLELHDSQISAQAALNGGLLDIYTGHIAYLQNSRISSNSGRNGGNIIVDSRLLALNQSGINASAVNINGGNIALNTDFFVPSTDSFVQATGGPFGVAGEISLLGPVIDLTGSLAALPDRLLLSEPRLPADCGMKLGPDLSSFLVLGAGGLPVQPVGLQPGYIVETPVQKDNR